MSPNTVIISDALNMGALKEFGTPGDIALQALKAGIDILLCPPDIEAVINRMHEALESGEYSEAELDAHVLKILQVKESLGLHEQLTRALPALELYEDLIQEAYDAATTACNGFAELNTNNYKAVTLGNPIAAHAPFYDPAISYEKPLCICLYPGGYKMHRLSEALVQNLKQIISSNPGSIVFLFGSPYCLIDIPHTVPTVLLYEDVVYTHATAEKLLAQQIMLLGTLPITVV